MNRSFWKAFFYTGVCSILLYAAAYVLGMHSGQVRADTPAQQVPQTYYQPEQEQDILILAYVRQSPKWATLLYFSPAAGTVQLLCLPMEQCIMASGQTLEELAVQGEEAVQKALEQELGRQLELCLVLEQGRQQKLFDSLGTVELVLPDTVMLTAPQGTVYLEPGRQLVGADTLQLLRNEGEEQYNCVQIAAAAQIQALLERFSGQSAEQIYQQIGTPGQLSYRQIASGLQILRYWQEHKGIQVQAVKQSWQAGLPLEEQPPFTEFLSNMQQKP